MYCSSTPSSFVKGRFALKPLIITPTGGEVIQQVPRELIIL